MCNLQHYNEHFNIRIMKIDLVVEAGMAFKRLICQTLFLSNNNGIKFTIISQKYLNAKII